MKILFMGTPEIAALCLEKLIENGDGVIGVVTAEDKPRGRGYVLTPSPVKTVAEKYGIAVYQPKTLKDDTFASLLKSIDPDIIVVVAYGKILPGDVINYPRYGCVNLHVSLLPKYRGAAPMQRAIMNGEKTTGVTVMYMDEGLDTGDILAQEEFPIEAEDNFEDVYNKSVEIGKTLLCRVLPEIENGTAPRTPQGSGYTYAEKIEKEDCIIDFSKTSGEIDCKIRGLSPIPLAFTHTKDGKILKVYKAKITEGHGKCGEVIALDDKKDGRGIVVATKDSAISLCGVVPEGKGRMSAGDFIRGRKINVGDILF